MKTNLLTSTQEAKILTLPEKHFPKKLFVTTSDFIYAIDRKDLTYLKASGNYTEIYSESHSKIISAKTLKSYQAQLGNKHFVRTHQSYLVNIEMITKISLSNPSEITLKGGVKIPISRSRKIPLIQLFQSVQ